MKYQRWIACADNHGDMADAASVSAFFEFAKHWKPHVRIHLGDAFDFRWLRGRASEGEKRERTIDDINAGLDFIRQYKPHHFLTGNHDHRLWRAADCDDGKLRDFASYLLVDIKDALGNAALYPWDKRKGVARLGKLGFLHGYHSGIYAVRQAALIYGSCCMGHIHASDVSSIPGIERREGHSSGCLCKVDLDYNRGSPNTLRQSNGWLYGLTFASGDFIVWHAERIGGSFYLPSEMREVRCA